MYTFNNKMVMIIVLFLYNSIITTINETKITPSYKIFETRVAF